MATVICQFEASSVGHESTPPQPVSFTTVLSRTKWASSRSSRVVQLNHWAEMMVQDQPTPCQRRRCDPANDGLVAIRRTGVDALSLPE